MAKIFITGSVDGLGKLTATLLIKEKHEVVVHARNEERAKDAQSIRGAAAVVVGDLSSHDETVALAGKVNQLGRFDAIIHNAGVYNVSAQTIARVNTFAPYILTCLITKPARLVYLSSGEHLHGQPNLESLREHGRVSYGDSKFHVTMLAKAVARRFPDIYSNSVDPGWVPTKMGGRNAPDDLDKGYETQAWLAVSNDPKALVSGKHFYHKKEARYRTETDDIELQDKFLSVCEQYTGVKF